jgi:hypothetical protein
MTKNNEGEKISDNLKRLIYEIPLEQRKRIKQSKSYREGWMDCTLFWKLQFNKTFKAED